MFTTEKILVSKNMIDNAKTINKGGFTLKKIILSMLLALSVVLGTVAFAEGEAVQTKAAQEDVIVSEDIAETEAVADDTAKTPAEEHTSLGAAEGDSNLVITMDLIDHPIMIDTIVRAYFFDEEGNSLAMDDAWVGGITKQIKLELAPPKFIRGNVYKVKITGLRSVTYNNVNYAPNTEITLDTTNGTCDFSMTGDKPYELQPVIYVEGEIQKLTPRARIVNGVTMVPIFKLAPIMGFDVGKNDKYNSIAVWVGNKKVAFNIGSSITNVFGTDVDMGTNIATVEIDGNYYVPIRPLTEYFECSLEVLDFGDHIDVCIGESEVAKRQYEQKLSHISSKTNWLIYVDKSDFKVRVYKGRSGKWILQKTYPCAIGAPWTPTITGQFEYQWKEYAWHYGTYYVGPIMRFYNGYALHSTLRYYGGGEYDGRVGVMISHGCVRMKPNDIQWMWDNIPLHTKIYITE